MYLTVFHSSSNLMLCFWGVVASILGNNRDLVLGVDATFVCLVVHKGPCHRNTV
jgi:hypothetical protein